MSPICHQLSSPITEEPPRGVCEKHESEIHHNFKPHLNFTPLVEEFYALHFKNYQRNTKSNVKIFDKDEFMNNLTTSNDLHYRIIPNKYELCGPLPKFDQARGIYEPRPDELASYGNQTKFGLIEYIKYKNRKLPIDWTFARINYICHPKEAYTTRSKPFLPKLNKIFDD